MSKNRTTIKSMFNAVIDPAKAVLGDHSALKKENEQLRQEVERLNAVNRDLQKRLEATPETLAPAAQANDLLKLSFTHEGAKWGFNYAAVQMDGKRITADDVCADPTLQAKLIARRSGMVKQLNS